MTQIAFIGEPAGGQTLIEANEDSSGINIGDPYNITEGEIDLLIIKNRLQIEREISEQKRRGKNRFGEKIADMEEAVDLALLNIRNPDKVERMAIMAAINEAGKRGELSNTAQVGDIHISGA